MISLLKNEFVNTKKHTGEALLVRLLDSSILLLLLFGMVNLLLTHRLYSWQDKEETMQWHSYWHAYGTFSTAATNHLPCKKYCNTKCAYATLFVQQLLAYGWKEIEVFTCLLDQTRLPWEHWESRRQSWPRGSLRDWRAPAQVEQDTHACIISCCSALNRRLESYSIPQAMQQQIEAYVVCW